MSATLDLLQVTAMSLCKNILSSDERYCRLQEESIACRKRFMETNPQEFICQALDLLDANQIVSSLETEMLFQIGLQMGLELGGLNLLPEE